MMVFDCKKALKTLKISGKKVFHEQEFHKSVEMDSLKEFSSMTYVKAHRYSLDLFRHLLSKLSSPSTMQTLTWILIQCQQYWLHSKKSLVLAFALKFFSMVQFYAKTYSVLLSHTTYVWQKEGRERIIFCQYGNLETLLNSNYPKITQTFQAFFAFLK